MDELKQVVENLQLTLEDLYLELQTREEYGAFTRIPLMKFGTNQIRNLVNEMEYNLVMESEMDRVV